MFTLRSLSALLLALLWVTDAIRAPELMFTDTTLTPCEDGSQQAGACPYGKCGFSSCPLPVSCRGGGCMFLNCTSPTCDGGGCKFVDCAHPTCRGGACDFVRTQTLLLDSFCPGGGCTNEGFPTQHKPTGGSSF